MLAPGLRENWGSVIIIAVDVEGVQVGQVLQLVSVLVCHGSEAQLRLPWILRLNISSQVKALYRDGVMWMVVK